MEVKGILEVRIQGKVSFLKDAGKEIAFPTLDIVLYNA